MGRGKRKRSSIGSREGYRKSWGTREKGRGLFLFYSPWADNGLAFGFHPTLKGRIDVKKLLSLIALLAVTGFAGSLWADNFSGTTNTTTVSTVSKTKSKTKGSMKAACCAGGHYSKTAACANGNHVGKVDGTAPAGAGKTTH